MPGTDPAGGEMPPLQVFLQAALGALGGDRGVIILKDGSEDLRLGAIMPLDTDVAVNRVVLKAVLKEGNAVLCNGVQEDSRFNLTESQLDQRAREMTPQVVQLLLKGQA